MARLREIGPGKFVRLDSSEKRSIARAGLLAMDREQRILMAKLVMLDIDQELTRLQGAKTILQLKAERDQKLRGVSR